MADLSQDQSMQSVAQDPSFWINLLANPLKQP